MSQFDELPEGWEIVTLEEILKEGKIGLVRSAKLQHPTEGTPYIRMQHYDLQGNWNFQDLTKIKVSKEEFETYELISGDILFNTRNSFELVGKVAIWPSQKRGYVYNNNLMRLRFFPQTLSKWIAYQMVAPKFRRSLEGTKSATTSVCAIYGKELMKQRLLISPLNEQRRIVEKVEALTARSRRAREALAAIPELLDQFRQSVLAAAFRGDLTADWRAQNPDVEPAEVLLERIKEEDSLPFGWCTASLGNIIESLKYGTSKKCSYEENGVPVLRIPNVSEGMIKHDDIKYAELTDKEIQDFSLIPGDILLIRSNGSVSLVGKTALAKESEQGFAYAGYLIRVRPNQQLVIPEYLDFCLSSYDLRMQIEVPARSTSGVHNINSKEVQKLQIPLAPLAEQKEIVRKILDFYSAVTQLESVFGETLVEHEQLDRAILAKAFRGELVPQDPTDEPAAVLLARIRAERDKLNAQRKSKKTPARRKKASP